MAKKKNNPNKFVLDSEMVMQALEKLGALQEKDSNYDFEKQFGRNPDQKKFVNPFNHKGWLAYFAQLRPRFQYVRFLGLPHLKDNPDVLLERLYVPIFLGTEYVSADRIDSAEKNTIEDIFKYRRRLVILGDPGAGKSILINYLTTLFASKQEHLLASRLGQMIPLPFILRDFSITSKVTFEDLLRQFQNQSFWPSGKLPVEELRTILKKGQALIMLDGLDEIGDVEKRKALRRAILQEGIQRYPTCVWLLTSRVVGYEDASFHTNQKRVLKKEELISESNLKGLQTPFYILPFNSEQIKRFGEKWYALREADKSKRDESVRSLLKAIDASDSIKRLAHNPNLLTMIALIHRVYAKLPSGRSLLYDKITEAYLESIDEFRGIHRESSATTAQHRQWLSALAYDMQKERTGKNEEAPEILIPKAQVKEKMRQFLGEAYDVDKELDYITRRSGLLLPRKPGFCNFVHLSFQEYFAALYLYEGLMSFDRRGETAELIKELRDQQLWHECLIFLFEKLADHPGASDWLFEQLFYNSDNQNIYSVFFATELLSDFNSGVNDEKKYFICDLIMKFTAKEGFNHNLIQRINSLPESVWSLYFMTSLENYLKKAAQAKEELSSNVLIFIQGLQLMDLNVFETMLSQTVLSNEWNIKNENLFYLFPFAYLNDGPVKHEMLKRMPVREWLSRLLLHSPVYALINQQEKRDIEYKKDFLSWCSPIILFSDILMFKIIFLANLENTKLIEKLIINIKSSSQDIGEIQEWTISKAIQDNKHDPILTTILYLINMLNFFMKLCLDKIRESFLNFKLEQKNLNSEDKKIIIRDIGLINSLNKSLTGQIYLIAKLVRIQAKQYQLHNNKPLNNESLALKVVTALLSGNDSIELSYEDDIVTAKEPLGLISFHMAQLVIGQGGLKSWQIIQEQVKIISNPKWIEENLAFLEPEEMKTALQLMNLYSGDKEPFFHAEYFGKGHPLASVLNAKPSEFAAAIDRLAARDGNLNQDAQDVQR